MVGVIVRESPTKFILYRDLYSSSWREERLVLLRLHLQSGFKRNSQAAIAPLHLTTMNNGTDDGGGFLSSGNIGGYGYGIGVSLGLLILITTILLASYYCTRVVQSPTSGIQNNANLSPPPPPRLAEEDAVVVVDIGIDQETIRNFPKLLYSEAKIQNNDSSASCCSICLADYKNSDVLRILPDCGHLFHLKCVDPWLRLHPTCPVCRTSPIPTPLSTPLAEQVPLAR